MSFSQAPSKLSAAASKALLEWGDLDESQYSNALEKIGSERNVVRHAEAWGPHIIALLSEKAGLEPGANPLKLIEELIAETPSFESEES